MSSDTQPAMTYPTTNQYTRWKTRADDLDMSVSEFMQAMIEAGMKKFDVNITPDETNRELREQRSDLKAELERTRSRVANLEEQVHQGEREALIEFVEQHPGATFNEIVQHVINTVPKRVNRHLDELEGDAIRVEKDCYYPAETEWDNEAEREK